MPHLECAARLHWRVANVEGRLAATREALDLLDRGVVVTDSDARVLLMNASAEMIIKMRDGLTCAGGRLNRRRCRRNRAN